MVVAAALVFAPDALAQQTTHEHDAPNAVVPAWWDVNDSDALLQRMQQAAAGNPTEAARNISAALLHGVEPHVAAYGLHALAALARPEGTLAVQRFLVHRRPTLRRYAVAAAVAIGGPALSRSVEARVADPDADVRGDAAMALGDMGDRAAIGTLWTALDRELGTSLRSEGTPLIRGCAHSIARLSSADDVERLLGYVRRAPLRSLTEAFEIALARDNIPESVKERVVTTVGNLATGEARDFLLHVVQSHRGRPARWVDLARAGASRIAAPEGGS